MCVCCVIIGGARPGHCPGKILYLAIDLASYKYYLLCLARFAESVNGLATPIVKLKIDQLISLGSVKFL